MEVDDVNVCPRCGYKIAHSHNITPSCPACTNYWKKWTLQLPALPQPEVHEQIEAWLGQLPHPSCVEISAAAHGLSVNLYTQPGMGEGVTAAWASLTRQQSRWKKSTHTEDGYSSAFVLRTSAILPQLAGSRGDSLIAVGGQLLQLAHQTRGVISGPGSRRGIEEVESVGEQLSYGDKSGSESHPSDGQVSLRLWVLGREKRLQDRLRALGAYNYGSESGVDADTPNPWGLRLGLYRAGIVFGGFIAAVCGGALAVGWISIGGGVIGILAGGLAFVASIKGTMDWMCWRSIPKEVLERSIEGPLLRIGITLSDGTYRKPSNGGQLALDLVAGEAEWKFTEKEWTEVLSHVFPLPAADLARLITPPEGSEGSGIIAPESRQDIPAPPPSQALVAAPFKIGRAVATDELVGIDPDGHGLAIGGSRTGKSSFVYQLLSKLAAQGEEAPGIFLVDPHASLADGFLGAVDQLPKPLRDQAIRRLRVITPDQPEVVPLNLLAIPDFAWAGNAIVQAGRRIWDDYWGPRMQAALLGLFRLAHAWNLKHPQRRMGLLHVVFAAFNTGWRRSTMAYLDPVDRMGALALDALLGQLEAEPTGWSQRWATEVVSPVLSKAMALELSPWLFAAMHQNSFVDLERWVRERAWIVMRLPSGTMGREGARLTAGIFYNVFDAAFRKATLEAPIPFYFVVDEAQEIAGGMQLEAMLAEGAKFGARMFVLAQSLSMLRRVEGFEPVVQALLANTSTQAFFSPDPEDADLIRATLSATVRYGPMTLDLPSLVAWLRARLEGRWQPPTLIEIEPLARAEPARIQTLIREVIEAHPQDYVSGENWQDNVVRTMEDIVPYTARGLLDKLLVPSPDFETNGIGEGEGEEGEDSRRLGW